MDLHHHRAKIYPVFVALIKRFFVIFLGLFAMLLFGWPLASKLSGLLSQSQSQAQESHLSVVENVMQAPRFTSETDKGEPYEVCAVQAKGALSGLISLTRPEAKLLKDGTAILLSADQGQFQQKRGILKLKSHVDLKDVVGYRLQTEQAYADLKIKQVSGNQPVHVSGPSGTARADRFMFQQQGQTNILVLKGKPRLVIHPHPPSK